MKKRELVNVLFQNAYHSADMTIETRKFLKETFPLTESKHLDAMYHFLNVLSTCESDNENPFVLGMLYDAWNQFLNEQMPA